MLEIVHRESSTWGWTYDCPTVSGISGSARSLPESVDSATHAARWYLEADASRTIDSGPVTMQVVHRFDCLVGSKVVD